MKLYKKIFLLAWQIGVAMVLFIPSARALNFEKNVPRSGVISPLTPTISSGGYISLTCSAPNISGDYTYQWQISTDATDWTDLPGATSRTYHSGSLTSTTYFRLLSTFAVPNGVTLYSGYATVSILTVGSVSPSSSSINYNTSPGLLSYSYSNGEGVSHQWQSSVDDEVTWIDLPGANSLTYQPGNLTQTTSYRVKSSKDRGTAFSYPVTIKVWPELLPSGINQGAVIYYNASVIIGGAPSLGGNGVIQYSWQSSPDNVNWTDIPNVTTKSYTTTPMTVTTFFRRKSTSNGVSVFSNVSKITVLPELVPGTLTPAAVTIDFGAAPGILTCTAASGGDGTYIYQWQSSVDNATWTDISGANTLTYTPGSMTTTLYYRVKSTSNSLSVYSNVSKVLVNGCFALNTNPSNNKNYITTDIFTAPVKSITSVQVAGMTSCEVQQSIEYIDGLGRSIQTVQVKGSPSGNDFVMPNAYDSYGRKTTSYLPYSFNGTSDGSYKSDALSNAATSQSAFYSGSNASAGITTTTTPRAVTVYELSPLNRIVEQGAPGDSWQLNAGHTQKIDYGTNNLNVTYSTTGFAVRSYNALSVTTPRHFHERILSGTGYYAANQLSLTITKDENWVTSDGKSGTLEEYKDKEGNVILKRAFNSSPAGIQILSTYYVYDDYGNLSFVLTPGSNPDAESVPSQTVLDNFCYQYRYDQRKRLIEKKIPGKLGWEEVIYSPIDQPVFTQDSVQRAAQQRSFIKYDAFGRVVMTGVEIGHVDTRQNIQDIVNILTPLWETRDNSQTNLHGYNNLSCPSNRPNLQPEVINYYDDYNIPDLPNNLSASFSKMTKGLLTATKIKVLGTVDKYLWTVNYYDDKGNLTRVYQQHYKGTVQSADNYDMISNAYSFTGQLLSRTRSHYVNGTQNLYVYNEYSYDHMGRLINSKQKTGDNSATTNPLVLLSKNTYNEIGQLISKGLHGTGSIPVFAQTIKYKYNERGWLLAQTAPLFAMELKYELDSVGLVPQYNGNISAQKWGLNTSLSKQYVYGYDKLNRLSTSISKDNNNERTGYDLMGNLTRLQRDAAGSLVDQIRYNYSNGNRLESVVDSNAHTGTNFQLPGTTSYSYDPNGNMTERINTTSAANNMYSMSYNHLNLPTTINANGAMITYTYDATGNKLKKQVSGSVVMNNEYISGIQYENGVLKSISSEAGRVVRNSPTDYSYEYTLADHLGNGRVFFNVNSSGTATKIQETDYYAFGLDIQRSLSGTENKYQYNGKEKQDQEKMFDYGARFYDPVIGRWNAVDPLAEKYDGYSAYGYSLNNPILFIDPNGEEVWIYYGDGSKVEYRNGKLYNENGSKYKGKDSFVSTILNSLNKINSTEGGHEVIDQLVKSNGDFNFKNISLTDRNGKVLRAASFQQGKDGGGEFSMGFLMNNSVNEGQKIESTAHEMFHAYQSENGEKPTSVNKEIGAYLFGRSVAASLGYPTGGFGKFSPQGELYDKAMTGMMYESTKKFDLKLYNQALNNFKTGSSANASGLYNKFPRFRNQNNPVIKKFFPLIR